MSSWGEMYAAAFPSACSASRGQIAHVLDSSESPHASSEAVWLGPTPAETGFNGDPLLGPHGHQFT